MVPTLRRVLVLAALTSACGKTERLDEAPAPSAVTAPVRAACDRVTTMSVCSDYALARPAKDPALLAAACTKLGGTYVASSCPNTAVLGACTLGNGEMRTYYASGGAAYDAPRAEKECTSLYAGAWKPFLP
jgi:hypothetical protein